MSYKVLFCGTPEFARRQLEALLLDRDYEVVTVVSQPDRPSGRGHKLTPSPVKDFALKHNMPVLTPEKASDPAFIEELKKHTYDICIVVAYGQILKKNFLEMFPGKCVNLHASLLPYWRGAAPIQRSVMAGDSKTGICLQVVVPKLDAGPVIGEREMEITLEDSAGTVHDTLASLGLELLAKDLKAYLRGEQAPKLQDENLVTYAHKIDKAESDINWSLSALEIHNKVRGLALGPQASCVFQGKRLKIIKTLPILKSSEPLGRGLQSAGVVLEASGETLVIGCGEGSLQLLVVQPESKKPMMVSEFLRGYKVAVGGIFATE
ncbi:MAG: methionyl-tRNA formyltransferase [Bdellovibrionaceae bacterium]|nr:methionyl-tRNA formyltransferase [Pseudobdellovibrionaceae bacterium]